MGIRRWLFPRGYRAAYHYNRGTVAHQRGAYILAEAHLREALSLWPDFPEAWHNLGLSLAAQDRFEEAIEVYEHALSQNPRFPEAINSRAIALAKLGRIFEAMESFREALRLKLDYLNAQENLDRIARILDRPS